MNDKKQRPPFRKLFTPEEDAKLLDLFNRYPFQWQEIASQMLTRSAKQCKERYINYLSPNIKNSPWTDEEDEKLLKLSAQFGNRWKLISLQFPGRSPNNVKNRYHKFIRKIDSDATQAILEKHENVPKHSHLPSITQTIEEEIGKSMFNSLPIIVPFEIKQI